jgi:NAD(P)-dependent dehydrogenase (short-subunit alcohol dehydrogenase family)
MAATENNFAGKVAFITGGASGIGLGMARRFLAAGMKVAITDRDKANLRKVEKELASGGDAIALDHDVTDISGWARAADEAERRLGPVSVLCNNAGTSAYAGILDLRPEHWRWLIEINLTGVFNGVHTFAPRMVSRGSGYIVNTASMAGIATLPGPEYSAYVASKFGVVGFSEAVRHELEPKGIAISVICPGTIRTSIGANAQRDAPATAKTPGQVASWERMEKLKAAMPADRWFAPEKVGDMVLEALLNRRFFVITHPELVTGVNSRHRELEQAFKDAEMRDARK